MLKRLALVVALVVGVISPLQAAQQFYDKTDSERSNSGTITANLQCVALGPLGNSGFTVEVTGGATMTLAASAYIDAAQTAITIPVMAANSATPVTSFSGSPNMLYYGVASSVTNLSVCSTAYTSGTATVTIRSGAGNSALLFNAINTFLPLTVYPAVGTAVFSATACTLVAAGSHYVTEIDDFAQQSEGAYLQVYNESTATCAANDLWVQAQPGNSGIYTFPNQGKYFSAGIVEKWSAAPNTGTRTVYF